jgi:magnesium transporter
VGGTVHCVAYAGGRRVGEIPVEDISEVLGQADRFVWIGVHEPDEPLLRKLQEEFGLHDLAIEDALRAHQRPKLEVYDDALFVVLRTARPSAGDAAGARIAFGEEHVFVGPRFVLSVRHGPETSDEDVRARCEAAPALLARGPAFVLYALMDAVVDAYFPVVEALEADLQAIEDEIFDEAFDRETTSRVYRLQRDLGALKQAIAPVVDICNRLVRFDLTLVAEDTRPYFRDVYDHVIRIDDMLDSLRDLLATAQQVNLSLIAVAQNEAMKKLAGWAAIIAVPTMVAGIYGMNFKFMPELDWVWGYPATLAVTAALCAILYLGFRRSGWL